MMGEITMGEAVLVKWAHEEKMKIKTDMRSIQSVVMMGGEAGSWWEVGRMGVTRIDLYFENGQIARVPWLAVCKGDAIAVRINCAAVEYISYDTAGAKGG